LIYLFTIEIEIVHDGQKTLKNEKNNNKPR